MLESINPTTEELVASYQEHSQAEIDAALKQASKAFAHWRGLSFSARGERFKKLATLMREGAARFAELMAIEMGKPIAQGVAEIEKCAFTCEYFAENAEAFLADEVVPTEAIRSKVVFRPLGAILAIMPWNFPFWQVIRFAAPTLMAGNVALVKHAPNVTGCAHALDKLFREAGFPDGAIHFLDIAPDNVADRVSKLIAHPLIRAVTLTGSARAGRFVAAKAGEALKKCVLELGGSDAYVVLEDANLERAAETCVQSRLINSGQSCIAAKRFIVVKKIRDEFERLVVEKMQSKKVGSPLDESTDVGPLARKDLLENLHRQVQQSVQAGATLLCGGKLYEGKGFFYPPTVLSGATPGMAAFDEETFGPVAAIVVAKDDDEAIELANATNYGLGSAIFTSDAWRADSIASQLDFGNCFVNAMVKSDARLPFGGVKESGYGRELGRYGVKEFVNVKTIWVGDA
ncbi:MAG: NAD-dependent succinate-semialdehyde dehydrogenase [Chloroherpetonaceae bacterium]|nr:NAD-dependent succinate-semialdehyde dehydrogenase [Chloroherpetonaceae bacterium]